MPREDAKVEKMRANFGEEDIYRVMKCPHKHTQVSSERVLTHVADFLLTLQLGDIHIWSGRPEWEPRFEQIAKKHPKGGTCSSTRRIV